MKNYSQITYKYLRVHKKRTILTILGIALSVALITAIGTMAMSLRDKLIRQAISNNGDYHVSFSNVDGKDINKIKNNVDVKSSGITDKEGSGIISDFGEKEKDPESPPHRYLNIKGYDKNALEILNPKLAKGRLPKNSQEIAVDYWAVDYLANRPKIGDKITLPIGIRKDSKTGTEMDSNSWSGDEVFQETGKKQYTIVGLIKPKFFMSSCFMANGITFIDNINTSAKKSYTVFVNMNSMDNIKNKTDKIVNNLDSKPKVEYNNELLRLYAKSVNRNENVNRNYILAITFVILLVVICTIAVIYNAFNISVLERISQFGVLRCVGTTPSQIKNIVFKEAAILSVIGIPIGILMGIFSMKLVLYIVGFLNFRLLTDVKIVISPIILILSSLLGILTIYLSTAGPARQAARVSPLEAVRNSGSVKVEKIKKVKKANIVKLIFGIQGQFASRNLRRNKKRFRITIFSMIISIILFIVFGSLMDYSFKTGVADTNNPVNYSINSGHGIDDNIYKEISNIPAVEEVYKRYQLECPITTSEDKINPIYEKLSGKSIIKKGGNSREIQNVDFIAYSDNGLDSLNKNLKSGTINKDALNKENGVILVQTAKVVTKDRNSALIDITKYKVGDELEVPDLNANSNYKKLKVMAILDKGILEDEYNENEGLILITTEEVFKKFSGIKNCENLLIIAKPNVSHTEISNYLSKLTNKNSSYYFYTDYDADAKQRRNDNITISIFLYGFIGIIILIGCLNIENTISTNLIMRTKEFAVLKAIGMTQGAIKKMILLEGVFYGLLAALYGGILGTLLYYELFKILIGIQEVQWVIPWKNIFISVAGAITASLISSLIPMKRINSGVISEDLRIDN